MSVFATVGGDGPSLRTGVQTDSNSDRAHSHTEWRREHHLLAPPPLLLCTSSAPERNKSVEPFSFSEPETNFEKLEAGLLTLSPNT